MEHIDRFHTLDGQKKVYYKFFAFSFSKNQKRKWAMLFMAGIGVGYDGNYALFGSSHSSSRKGKMGYLQSNSTEIKNSPLILLLLSSSSSVYRGQFAWPINKW